MRSETPLAAGQIPYYTEIANFSNIVGHLDGADTIQWFEVHTKDGRTLEYGHTDDARIPGPLLGSGRPPGAQSYLLDRVTDRAGNTMHYNYDAKSTTSGQTGFESLLTSITYDWHNDEDIPAVPAQVMFEYFTTDRDDKLSGWKNGTLQEVDRLLPLRRHLFTGWRLP